jgi:hypothetical protein
MATLGGAAAALEREAPIGLVQALSARDAGGT